MRILILEDNAGRHKEFRQGLIGCSVTIVEKTHEAIRLLQEEKWDCLFLDHDLDGKIFQPSGPGTGFEVAEWLSQHRDRMPKKVITHSFHDEGRANIIEVLPGTVDAAGAWVAPKAFL